MSVGAAATLVSLLLSSAPAGAGPNMTCENVVNPAGANLDRVFLTLERWRVAVRAGDLDAVAGLVTEDVEFWSAGRPPLRGREALRDAFRPVFEEWELDQAFRCEELIVVDGFAFLRGTEVNRLTPKADGDPTVVVQRAFSLLREGPEGSWRFARGMTNAPPDG